MPTTITNPNYIYHFGDDHFLIGDSSLILFEGAGNPPRIPPFTMKPTLDLGPYSTWDDVLSLNGKGTLEDRYQIQALIHAHTDSKTMRVTESIISSKATLQHLALVQFNRNAIESVHPATAAAFLHLEVDQHGHRAMLNVNDLPAGLSTSELHDRVISLLEQEKAHRQ